MLQIRDHQIARPVTPASIDVLEHLGVDDPELAAVYRQTEPADVGVFIRSAIVVAAAVVLAVAICVHFMVPVEATMLIGP